MPVAKTKVFRVPERPTVSLEEQIKLKELFNNYRTAMKSLRVYFSNKTKQLSTGDEVIAELERREEEHHLNCILINEEWNRNIAQVREARVAKEREEAIEKALKEVELSKQEEQKIKAEAQALIRKEMEKSKSYITAENIDEAIEKALFDVKDFNFSIDLEGNIYRGRDAKPADKPEEAASDKNK